MVFDEAPAGLDGAEVGRIRRQEDELSALGLDQVTDYGRVIRTKVVKHDDVVRKQTWAKALADVLDEARTVDRADQSLMAEHTVVADGADRGEVLAPLGGLVVEDALAALPLA